MQSSTLSSAVLWSVQLILEQLSDSSVFGESVSVNVCMVCSFGVMFMHFVESVQSETSDDRLWSEFWSVPP